MKENVNIVLFKFKILIWNFEIASKSVGTLPAQVNFFSISVPHLTFKIEHKTK